ncbi:MAG TPA: hypothetical protein VH477_03875 [Bryobacteraceae bacterium]
MLLRFAVGPGAVDLAVGSVPLGAQTVITWVPVKTAAVTAVRRIPAAAPLWAGSAAALLAGAATLGDTIRAASGSIAVAAPISASARLGSFRE